MQDWRSFWKKIGIMNTEILVDRGNLLDPLLKISGVFFSQHGKFAAFNLDL